MADEFDLGEMLAERIQPTSKVYVYLNEAASYARAELVEAAKKSPSPEKAEEIEKAIEKIDADLEKTKYTFTLRAVPSRMREDISSKAMHAFPIKSIPGTFMDENGLERMKHENNLIWAAQIESIQNPAGKVNTDFSLEDIVKLTDHLPTHAQNQIDNAIKELTTKAEQYTASVQDLDFS